MQCPERRDRQTQLRVLRSAVISLVVMVACHTSPVRHGSPTVGTYRLALVAGSAPPAVDLNGPPRFIIIDSGRVEILPVGRYRSMLAVLDSAINEPAAHRISTTEGTFVVAGNTLTLQPSNARPYPMTFDDSRLSFLTALGRRLEYKLIR